jgi:hypothetical protein
VKLEAVNVAKELQFLSKKDRKSHWIVPTAGDASYVSVDRPGGYAHCDKMTSKRYGHGWKNWLNWKSRKHQEVEKNCRARDGAGVS